MPAEKRSRFTVAAIAATVWLACGGADPAIGLASNVGNFGSEEVYTATSHACEGGCAGRSLYWHNPCEAFGRDPCERDPWCFTGVQATAPKWYVASELLPLFRYQDSIPFQSLQGNNNNGEFVLESSDVDSGFAGGMRLLLGRSLGESYRFEASYFGSHSWSDQKVCRNVDINALGLPGNLFSPFSKFGTPAGQLGVDFNNFASIDFSSTLNNGEINLRRRIGHCHGADTCDGFRRAEASLLIGLRYTKMLERLRYRTRSRLPLPGGTTNNVVVHTDNDMLGVQLGFLSQLNFCRRSWIDFDVKGVVYANRAGQRTDFVGVDENGVVTSFGDGDQEDVASFMVDLSLMYNYQFAHSWTIRAGYNGMFLMAAALASDNFNTKYPMLSSGPASLSHSGTVTYHGPSIAVVWTR